MSSTLEPDTLPVIDCGGLGQGEAAEAALARELDAAFRDVGFCYFRNIGVAPDLVDGLFAASRDFHALPEAAKRALSMNKAHRGYMAPNTSLIVTSSVAQVKRPNYSESLMIMHEVAPDDPRHGTEVHGPNQWPDLPGFRDAVEAYEAAIRRFCLDLLRPMAMALDLPPGWFVPHFAQPTTFLRLLHYPPQPPDSPDDAFGSAPHTDYGFLTVLCQDNAGGLEVRRRDGAWLKAPPIPGTWVVNVADMLSRWTNGRWQSTPHRVRNLSGGDRYSCPYFFDMSMDSIVECLPSCTDAANPPRHPPVRYGDYLMERLDRNYRYRQGS
ncbi:MAG TPA: 2-oxoglutarate and iron-dependent oxygenase domain-containing protein [Acetobacteraceae bacterium]